MKRLISMVVVGAMTVAMLMVGTTQSQAASKVKTITMNKNSITLNVGAKYTLKVKKVKPSKGSKAVLYKSTNTKVASVTKKGKVTAKSVGSCKIKVTSKQNKKVTANVKVKVVKVQTQVLCSPTISPTTHPISTVVTQVPSLPTQTPTEVKEPTASPEPTPRITPTPRPTSSPTPTPTIKPSAEPADLPQIFNVSLNSENNVFAEGIGVSNNEDGSITLDFDGTELAGARFFFDTPLNLSEYSIVYVDGEEGEIPGITCQLLDALDKDDYGNALGVGIVSEFALPMVKDYSTDDLSNVKAFELYSSWASKETIRGPITIKSIKFYRSQEDLDKDLAGELVVPDKPDSENEDKEITPYSIDLEETLSSWNKNSLDIKLSLDDSGKIVLDYTGTSFVGAQIDLSTIDGLDKYTKLEVVFDEGDYSGLVAQTFIGEGSVATKWGISDSYLYQVEEGESLKDLKKFEIFSASDGNKGPITISSITLY